MPFTLTRRSLAPLALGFAAALAARTGRAAALPVPTGTPILVISGKIRNTNQGGRAVFDRAMLEQLGMETVVTHTPWFKQPTRFEGVRLAKLMEYVGAYGDRVMAQALNDYSSELPLSDFKQFGTLLALKRDGEYMPVSDKGPLFIIYPFDTSRDLQQDRYYMRSVWQLSELDVR